jgi:hypothetical protein
MKLIDVCRGDKLYKFSSELTYKDGKY